MPIDTDNPAPRTALWRAMDYYAECCRPRRRRSMAEFACQEIVIPDGPYKGWPYAFDVQFYPRLYLEAVGSGLWPRTFATGPVQSGKSLTAWIIPAMYHLFEIGETVICGLPNMDLARDKLQIDLLPVIELTGYRELLPTAGGGSRGGTVTAVRFRNGATLRFMTGGGGDKSRAGFTSRVLVVTETDGFDESGEASREADKFAQLEGRTRAWGPRRRVYAECTVTIEAGRTWREWSEGTASRIFLPCPHCRQYVIPGREHLVGWQDAASIMEARAQARFCCPRCGQPWTEEERKIANQNGVLVHRGQEIVQRKSEKSEVRSEKRRRSRRGERGRSVSSDSSHFSPLTSHRYRIVGEAPKTDTLGFRWEGVHNLFVSAADLAADEWRAARAADEENALKEVLQYLWCVPYTPPAIHAANLTVDGLMARVAKPGRGSIPEGTEVITAHADLGKYLIHWLLVAWRAGGGGQIADYGRIEVATDDLGLEPATLVALRELRDLVAGGWPRMHGERAVPDVVTVDCAWNPDPVYAFIRESDQDTWYPTLGFGASQTRHRLYTAPKKRSKIVVHLGERYHVTQDEAARCYVVHVDGDFWKSYAHQRLACRPEEPGAVTLYAGLRNEHQSLVRHLTAEHEIEEFVAGKGTVVKWVRDRKNNHWLDCFYNCCWSAHFCGIRLIEEEGDAGPRGRGDAESRTPAEPAEGRTFALPDGRAFFVGDRR